VIKIIGSKMLNKLLGFSQLMGGERKVKKKKKELLELKVVLDL
jgi:hypothetical protein